MAPQGLDVLFSKERLEVGRNFMNKLWNACRFIQLNLGEEWDSEVHLDYENTDLELPERWIISRLSNMIQDYNNQLDRFHFNEAAKDLYEFTWNDLCDWYLEIAKNRFYGEDESKADIARVVAIECIRTVLTLLHPYSPFITEELWSHFKPDGSSDLIIMPWIKNGSIQDKDAEDNMDILKEVITSIRSIRSRMNVPPSTRCNLVVRCNDDQKLFIDEHTNLIQALAGVNNISTGKNLDKPSQSATAVSAGMELYIPLKGLVDLEGEKSRMEKRILEIDRLLTSINAKLSNQNFLQRAPEPVIEKERSNLKKLNQELEKVTANLEVLK